MKASVSNWLVVFALLSIVSCAHGPKYREIANPPPRIEGNKARIYFYRESQYGGAYQPNVTVNENVVGTAKPRGVFYRDFPPGEYSISTTMAQGTKVVLLLAAQEEKYIRLTYRIGFKLYPVLVENAVGQKEISSLVFIKP